MATENMCCLLKSLRLVFVANIFCKLDYVAYKLLLINHTACIISEPSISLAECSTFKSIAYEQTSVEMRGERARLRFGAFHFLFLPPLLIHPFPFWYFMPCLMAQRGRGSQKLQAVTR